MSNPTSSAFDPSAQVQPATSLLRSYESALNAADVEAIVGLYAEDGVFMAQHRLAEPDMTFPRVLGDRGDRCDRGGARHRSAGRLQGGGDGFIPTGVRLTAYGGGAGNLPSEVLSDIASAIHRGELDWPVEVDEMEDIARAHDDMEHNRVAAKQVVLTRGAG